MAQAIVARLQTVAMMATPFTRSVSQATEIGAPSWRPVKGKPGLRLRHDKTVPTLSSSDRTHSRSALLCRRRPAALLKLTDQ